MAVSSKHDLLRFPVGNRSELIEVYFLHVLCKCGLVDNGLRRNQKNDCLYYPYVTCVLRGGMPCIYNYL